MEYISAIEASEKWGVSPRQVQRLLADNRISRGTVTANGGSSGAGIGGGEYGDGGTVYISGGSVKAMAGGGTAQAIGPGHGGSGGTLTNGAENGNQAVNLTVAAIPGASLETEVVGLTMPGAAYYGTKDLCTDADGKLYLWLPGSMEGARVKTADKACDWNSSLSTFEADTALPTVTDVTPSGTNAPTSSYLAVTFSEEMRTEGTVSLDGGATSLTGGSWNADTKQFIRFPIQALPTARRTRSRFPASGTIRATRWLLM